MWRHWGSPVAKAVAISGDPKAHTRQKVRFSVTETQMCEGQTYCKTLLLEYPKRLNPDHLKVTLSCGSSPEGIAP